MARSASCLVVRGASSGVLCLVLHARSRGAMQPLRCNRCDAYVVTTYHGGDIRIGIGADAIDFGSMLKVLCCRVLGGSIVVGFAGMPRPA